MKLLITAAASPFAQFLGRQLAANHQVRLTERAPVDFPPSSTSAAQSVAQSAVEFVRSPLDHDHGTNLLVRDIDAVIHVAEPLATDNEYNRIDILTRCTYNLLTAAVQESIPQFVLLSTLALMTNYSPAYRVSERWRPHPNTDPTVLSKHLAEYTAREFAREQKINVTVLRLGQLVYADEEASPVGAVPLVAASEAARAVENVLTAPAERWAIYHIGNEATHPHFTMSKAKAKELV